jgi:hypothetical protein
MAAAGWEWRPVFCETQLARRPAPGVLAPVELPDSLTGPRVEGRWLAITRTTAAKTVRGRLPRLDDPHEVLAHAAARLPRSGQRPALEETLSGQVAWLVAERVGHSTGPLPPFDPGSLPPRERWNLLLDVLEPTRKLTHELGRAAGVDLLAPLVPKMQIDDDRVVPPGRRNRLPGASLARLPLNEWHVVGPTVPRSGPLAARSATGPRGGIKEEGQGERSRRVGLPSTSHTTKRTNERKSIQRKEPAHDAGKRNGLAA